MWASKQPHDRGDRGIIIRSQGSPEPVSDLPKGTQVVRQEPAKRTLVS